MKTLKNLYLIVGEMGTGKDTVVNTLCDKYHLEKLKSFATRKPRYPSENSHTFIDKNVMFLWRKSIIAQTQIDGNYYFSTQEQCDESDFYIIDKKGLDVFKKKYKGRPYKVIYLTAPCMVRQCRMLSRGDDGIAVGDRLIHDADLYADAKEWSDVQFTNIDLNETVADIWKYIEEQEMLYEDKY